jgi:protein gp37
MAERSAIEWTDHTFNPWIGCTRVSPGCQHCYAETLMDGRWNKVKWGPTGQRVRTKPAYWKGPVKWNAVQWMECTECGWRGPTSEPRFCMRCDCELLRNTRQRVFCASLADVFEDNPQVVEWRKELFQLIEQTPNLDWLLLTKRIENVERMIPDDWYPWSFPKNIWLGTSVEDQHNFDTRIPILESLQRQFRITSWLSAEPLLGPIDMTEWLGEQEIPDPYDEGSTWSTPIDWVIVGGESGAGHRPMAVEWAQDLARQCKESGTAFFMKQLGGHPNKRHDLAEFPEDLRVREFPK